MTCYCLVLPKSGRKRDDNYERKAQINHAHTNKANDMLNAKQIAENYFIVCMSECVVYIGS